MYIIPLNFIMKAGSMAGYTPPKIEDAPKSFIGVGTRELVIAAAGVVLAVLVYLSDMFAPLIIGLAIICAGIGIQTYAVTLHRILSLLNLLKYG